MIAKSLSTWSKSSRYSNCGKIHQRVERAGNGSPPQNHSIAYASRKAQVPSMEKSSPSLTHSTISWENSKQHY
eukprot:9836717-Ditylum_brightwellii.AAC.1